MSGASMLQRPIYGGVFGRGRYALATLPCVSNGLHAVRFMVVDPRAGSVLSVSEEKQEALSAARRALRLASPHRREAANDALWFQEQLWPADALPVVLPPAKKISARRREVFDRSHGRCHYCRTVLALDGRWHVEHMVPKALEGTDEPSNLVAACVTCNLSKGDRTALEFLSTPSPQGSQPRR